VSISPGAGFSIIGEKMRSPAKEQVANSRIANVMVAFFMMSLPIFDFGFRITDRGFHVLGAMITEGFDRYGPPILDFGMRIAD
jgi:hypothetical protein